jgi:hypothetical protein
MSKNKFEIKINVPMIKELVSDKIYRSDASAFREQYVNSLSHGCMAYHEEHGYTDDVYVHVIFDYGHRKVTITDNGQGMSKNIFSDNFMSFGFSTVDKETNNTRSGMFGLGAISFFRIASACIVESWNRKDNERFTFMTRNTDESEFVTNRTLKSPGTKTEIFLKEHVNIESLVRMIESIASNYPVKTILETINSEGQQSIATYQKNDQDRYVIFDRTEKFEDYVSTRTDGKYTTIINDDEMELYLSTTGGDYTNTFLCRVPIKMEHRTGFTAFINIKKEKIPGTDSFGKPKLQEVPKPDRDEVHERAFSYFTTKIDKLINDMIHTIDIKSFEEFQKSPQRWIVSGYSVDDKLNPLTHEFVQKLRHRVKYRSINGIQKKWSSLLDILDKTNHVFYHSSLHKGTYELISNHINHESIIFVNDTNGLPIKDAKQYKKDKGLIAPKMSSTGKSAVGILVRDGSWNHTRITSQTDIKKLWPGGIYYADNFITQYDIVVSRQLTFMRDSTYSKIIKTGKIGIVIAKTGEKRFPSLSEKINDIKESSEKNQILDNESKPILLKSFGDIKEIFSYSKTVIPIQWANFEFIKHMENEYIFVPSKHIHTINLLCSAGSGYERNTTVFTKILKYIPNWYKLNPKILASVLKIYPDLFRLSYNASPLELHADILNMIIDIKQNNVNITSDEFYEKVKIIESKYDDTYGSHINFDKIFPEQHLKEVANRAGYNETETSEDGNHVYAFTLEEGGRTPIKINGVFYSKIVDMDDMNVKIILDEDDKPILVDNFQNYDKRINEITEHDGKLQFKKEITKWMA